MELYQEELLDHYKYPRNYGTLPQPDVCTEILNPSCGDQISLQACFDNDSLAQVRFQGKGCVISQAAASLLTQAAVGVSLSVLEQYTKDDMLALLNIPLGPTRLRCALLALEALHTVVRLHKANSYFTKN